MTDFEQNEQNPLEEHDFFIENTIEEEEGSSLLKIAILALLVLGLLIGAYFLFLAGDDKKTSVPAETTEVISNTSDTTGNALENAAVDPNAETTDASTENDTGITSNGVENNNVSDTDAINNTASSTNATTTPVGTESTTTYDSNTNSDLHYFIIRGAFSEEANAQKSVEVLKTAGHNAVIVGKNSAGLYMVAYEGFATIGDAKTKLAEIRNIQGDAWIYKK